MRIPNTHELILEVEDTIAGERPSSRFDYGGVGHRGRAQHRRFSHSPDLGYDEYGFLNGATGVEGVFAAGCATHPCDVSSTTKESTAAALKAIQCVKRG